MILPRRKIWYKFNSRQRQWLALINRHQCCTRMHFSGWWNQILKRVLFASLLVIALNSVAQARNTRHTFKIQDVLDSPDYQQKVGNEVAFYFANQPVPRAAQNLGQYVTNKKTNAFARSDETACRWAML